MIKSELISNLSLKFNRLPEKDIVAGVNTILESMCETLSRGDRIEIRRFGSFSVHHRPKRLAHNPKTGEKVMTEDKYSPHFKPGKDVRDIVDQSRTDGLPIKDDSAGLL